jgi:hypothetical protein
MTGQGRRPLLGGDSHPTSFHTQFLHYVMATNDHFSAQHGQRLISLCRAYDEIRGDSMESEDPSGSACDLLAFYAHFNEDLDTFGHMQRHHLCMHPCNRLIYQHQKSCIRKLRTDRKQDGGVERLTGREDRRKGEEQRVRRPEKKGERYV